MDKAFDYRMMNSGSVFADQYMDGKFLYMYCFNSIPCVSLINYIDGEKAYKAFSEKFASLIQSVHTYGLIEKKKKVGFNITLIVLNNKCVIEFNIGYCEILYNNDVKEFAASSADFILSFKERQRKKPLEMNLIARSASYYELKTVEVKKTSLDLDLFYEDDFIQVDQLIKKRLNNKNDKGIVLLHGLPGTGKTTYLRHLIGKIKKRVLFLSPNIAGSLVDPEFIDLLISNPNSVLIIEDAENIIMDRKSSSNSSVSNLLNISDGLLADFLNVQLICTFNSSLTMIDSALMRKGRLIAKYEFGKLSMAKAQKLSTHFGFDTIIDKPMTIAEIANQHEKAYPAGRIEVIGFRNHYVEN